MSANLCRFLSHITAALTRYTVQTAINYVCGYTLMPQGKYLAGGLSLQVNTNFNIMHYTFRLYSQQIHRSNFVLWLSAVPYSFYFPSGLSYDNTDCPFLQQRMRWDALREILYRLHILQEIQSFNQINSGQEISPCHNKTSHILPRCSPQ